MTLVERTAVPVDAGAAPLPVRIEAAFFLMVFVLTIRFQRREGRRHPWFWPSLLLVVVGAGATVVTASGVALTGY